MPSIAVVMLTVLVWHYSQDNIRLRMMLTEMREGQMCLPQRFPALSGSMMMRWMWRTNCAMRVVVCPYRAPCYTTARGDVWHINRNCSSLRTALITKRRPCMICTDRRTTPHCFDGNGTTLVTDLEHFIEEANALVWKTFSAMWVALHATFSCFT